MVPVPGPTVNGREPVEPCLKDICRVVVWRKYFAHVCGERVSHKHSILAQAGDCGTRGGSSGHAHGVQLLGKNACTAIRSAPMFRRKTYNRSSTLAAAEKARSQGQVRKAISGYSKIVEHEPHDYQVHARLAPLLAKVRRWEDSRKSFHAAGDGFLAAGFSDKAVAVWTMAAQQFPEDVPYWERIANEQVKRGRKADAVHTLLQGRGQLRSSFQRPLAIQLLEQVLVIDSHHFDATLDLVRLLRIEGQKPKAQKLLSDLSRDAVGPRLRRIRGAQFRLSPGFRTFFDWVLARRFGP